MGQALVETPVWAEHLATVNWLKLTRLEYADGVVWHPSPQPHCITSPSLLVLVGKAR